MEGQRGAARGQQLWAHEQQEQQQRRGKLGRRRGEAKRNSKDTAVGLQLRRRRSGSRLHCGSRWPRGSRTTGRRRERRAADEEARARVAVARYVWNLFVRCQLSSTGRLLELQAYLAINEGDSGLQLYVNFELFWIIKFWITKKTHYCT